MLEARPGTRSDPVPGPRYKPGSVASHLITIWTNLNNHLVQENLKSDLKLLLSAPVAGTTIYGEK